MTNPHFMVWMKTAGLPNFRKLWAVINQTLPAGNYEIHITNNYPASAFNGEKWIYISSAGPFGGINVFLSWAYILVGVACLGFSVIFFMKWKKSKVKSN